jgi:putative GTP pyrophosphokinase
MQAMLPPLDLSKSQVDLLGDRLRKGDISEDDLRLLDSYRLSFTDAYEDVVWQIVNDLGLEPTGRSGKSTTSIIDKLRRESIRLSQMQDIAGCRIIVDDIASQDKLTASLKALFERSFIVDRREHPSHGYRAVHVIVDNRGKLIEVQVRTSLQHRWAEFSEKLSDEVDRAIKYGGGDPELVSYLKTMSDVSMNIEMALNRKDLTSVVTQWQRWPELSRRLGERIQWLRSRDDFSN